MTEKRYYLSSKEKILDKKAKLRFDLSKAVEVLNDYDHYISISEFNHEKEINRLIKKIERLRNDSWLDINGHTPPMNKPILLCIGGVVQHETWVFEGDSIQSDLFSTWLLPYNESTDHIIRPKEYGNIKWRSLPKAPLNNDKEAESGQR